MTKSIADFSKLFVSNMINHGFVEKIFKYNNQSQIFTRDQGMERLNEVLVNETHSA